MFVINLSAILVLIVRLAELQAGTVGGARRNDYGPPIYISSSVLQLADSAGGTERSDVETASVVDPWTASGLSPGYEVWLDADAGDPKNYQSTALDHAGGGVPYAVFSADPTRMPPGTGLHTQVIASRPYKPSPPPPPISDNVDFDSVDLGSKTKQLYTQSYGR